MRLATLTVAAWLLLQSGVAAGPPLQLFDERGQREGTVVPGPGGSYNVYDRSGNRIGYGTTDRYGQVTIYDRQSNRVLTIQPDGTTQRLQPGGLRSPGSGRGRGQP